MEGVGSAICSLYASGEKCVNIEHPTLRRYDSCFVMVDDDYQRMGSLERPQETGRVDNRLTEQLQSAAKLSMFTHFSPEAYKEHIADP
jgi:hypothetical protein